MIKLLLRNLNNLSRTNYYYETIFDKFKYFNKIKLLLRNLNVLLTSNYHDETIVDKFKYLVKI
jgi:hypothetical protein